MRITICFRFCVRIARLNTNGGIGLRLNVSVAGTWNGNFQLILFSTYFKSRSLCQTANWILFSHWLLSLMSNLNRWSKYGLLEFLCTAVLWNPMSWCGLGGSIATFT